MIEQKKKVFLRNIFCMAAYSKDFDEYLKHAPGCLEEFLAELKQPAQAEETPSKEEIEQDFLEKIKENPAQSISLDDFL